jgi:glutathione S-transferase
LTLVVAPGKPAAGDAVSTPVLWQFRASHFNEKARWALDWKGIPHVRRSLLPGWHVPRMLWLTRQTQTPALQIDRDVVADSTRIIERLERLQPDPPLYPSDESARHRAIELEDFFDTELGPHLRRAVFFEALGHTDFAAALFATGESPTTRALYGASFPVSRVLMRLSMGIDAARAAESRRKVEAAIDRIEHELQPSGYLVGDAFSVADLTAAALLSPVVLPREFPYLFPSPLPESVQRYRDSLAGRRAVAWTEEMYRRHRGRSAEVAA